MPERSDLLRVNGAMFPGQDSLRVGAGLPGGDLGDEHVLHLFQRLAGRFGECEERVQSHAEAEDAEAEVRLPLDVLEARRRKVAQGEVEHPVRGCGD